MEDIMPKRPKKYIVRLTDKQRSELLSLVNKGEHNARAINTTLSFTDVMFDSHFP